MPQIDPRTGEVMQENSGVQIDPKTGEVVSQAPAEPEEPTFLQKAMTGAKDLGVGALRGAGSTANMVGSALIPDRLVKAFGGTPPTTEQQEGYFKPANTMQAIGKGVEQAGEFLLPGGAEEQGAEAIGKLAPKIKPLAKVLTSAVGSGVVNKAQGGTFAGGAAAGAAGGAIAHGLQSIAPSIAESSIGIRKLDRAYGRTPGRAILDETKGFAPGTVAESAQGVLNTINPELDKVVRAGNPVDLAAPRGVIDAGKNTAISRNAAGSFNQLEPMAKHLSEEFSTGAPIPQVIDPVKALNLKRGFGDEYIHNWNPETMSGTRGIAAKTYRSLADEIHSAAPGSAELDERASSLIPVAKRAASADLNAPAGQRVLHRFGAHTGALAGGLFGANEGYKERGIPGAIAGGLLGVALPEAIASPTGQMMMARTLNSGASRVIPKAFGGMALQLNRPDDEDENKKRDRNQ